MAKAEPACGQYHCHYYCSVLTCALAQQELVVVALIYEPEAAILRFHATYQCSRYMYAAPRTPDGQQGLRTARSGALDRALLAAISAAAMTSCSARCH